MSYYRRLPTDVRVALWLGKPHVRQWFVRAAFCLGAVVVLAVLAKWAGLR